MVVAIGFQARWFERLLGGHARGRLATALAGDELERRIDLDLSVAGLSPPLHLPLVAGLAQGPGFPNLSCLGLLSDRVPCAAMSRRRSRPPRRPPWRPRDGPRDGPRDDPRDDREEGACLRRPSRCGNATTAFRRTVVLPTELAERLAAQAQRRGLSVSDLLTEYARVGLTRDGVDI